MLPTLREPARVAVRARAHDMPGPRSIARIGCLAAMVEEGVEEEGTRWETLKRCTVVQ